MVPLEKILLTPHARQRMLERRIRLAEIQAVLSYGKCIEEYPTDVPYPSRLLCYGVGGRALHVVCAMNHDEDCEIIITVYEPDPTRWVSPAFEERGAS